MQWFKSKTFDLSFFVLSPLVSLLVAVAFIATGKPFAWVAPIYLVFTAFFDQPHIFLTFSRTHLDKDEFARHTGIHTLGFFAIVAATFAGLQYQRELFLWFFHGLGSFHIYRQNIGFFRLYSFSRHAPATKTRMEIIYSLLFLNAWVFALAESVGVQQFSLTAELLLLGALLFSARENPRSPALWLLTLSAVANWVSYAYIGDELVGTAIETLYHNIQYFGFMWLYMRRVNARSRFFAPGFMLISLAYGIVIAAATGVVRPDMPLTLPLGVMLGLVIYHYVVEAFIWKFRSQKELAALLVQR